MLRPAIAVVAALGLVLSMGEANAERQRTQRSEAVARLKMEAVPRLTADDVRKVQQLLKAKGFDPGDLDGLPGPQTKDAIRKFQERYGINARGVIDNQTLFALGAAHLAGEAER